MIIVFTAGGFDPIHVGHLEMLEKAKRLGDILIVSVAKDKHLIDKKGYVYMREEDRRRIVAGLKCVDMVEYHLGDDGTVIENIKRLDKMCKKNGYNLIFAKGGDRYKDEIPERFICEELGVEIIDGLGEKIRSSSELIKMEDV